MKVSTRGRYALRLMLDIAIHSNNKPVSIKEIASRQDISEKYLEQIIAILNNAEFVRSVRGAQGGYLLKKEPSEITVGMILRLTEGSIAPVACVEEENIACNNKVTCGTRVVWEKLNDAINNVVDNITIKDLMDSK